ncbi:hypothetical protein Pla52o_14480 [Novipirellula galeiformis]|uniref:Planctomycete cytochrome C n=1 Tax=Novipirellula galeiformis TaxID=2528004 RepID=A0A5C6CKM8_9BACT|nr:DUF1592 domain-containing protein [Novipirellula galeiformis]TWU25150.1 hypothetical protein Pla52o_14480 [Novipirellula galeiformis]
MISIVRNPMTAIDAAFHWGVTNSMTTNPVRRFLCWLALATLTIGVPTSATADQASHEATFRDALLPLLRTYCFDCHDSGTELSLVDDDSAAKMQMNRELWKRVIAQVQLGSMPPEDGETMDAAIRQRMVKLLDETANAVDCVQNPNAGKVVLRRLNRAEYRNTIKDLLEVDYEPARGFPGDDVGYGFDNIGDVLSLPPILLEKYLDAAEAISGQAIVTPLPPRIYELEVPATSLKGAEKLSRGNRVSMSSKATVSLELDVPFTGEYILTISASGDQGGDEPAKMQVDYGKVNRVIDVPATRSERYEVPFRLARGTRKIDITFINDFYIAGKVDRNLHLYHVHVFGTETEDATEVVSESDLPPIHKKILFTRPSKTVSPEHATAQVIAPLASRAFRRPATKNEVMRLTQLASQVRSDGASFEESIQVALQAILVSPHFLFKVEQHATPDPSGELPRINQYELATRISYFLWSSMPDDELLSMAHQGKLHDRRELLRKVGDMIVDPRSNQFIENFAGQWLQLRNLETVDPDASEFPAFNDEIRQAMRRETLTFVAAVMRENLPVTSLLDADFTYLNEELAAFYGVAGVTGSEYRKVSLAGTPRGGLLTHASVLTVTSNPTRTSPVKRGKWILDNLLNTPPPPAPPNVPELDKGKLSGTLREQMEQHRSNPACAACHNMMDPLGFALENFDAIGRWRTKDGKDTIDASGKLPDGTQFNGADDLRRVLSKERSEQFVRCLAEKMLIYATGRGTEYYDRCAIDAIMAEMKERDNRFAYLISAIIQSEPFQRQGSRE